MREITTSTLPGTVSYCLKPPSPPLLSSLLSSRPHRPLGRVVELYVIGVYYVCIVVSYRVFSSLNTISYKFCSVPQSTIMLGTSTWDTIESLSDAKLWMELCFSPCLYLNNTVIPRFTVHSGERKMDGKSWGTVNQDIFHRGSDYLQIMLEMSYVLFISAGYTLLAFHDFSDKYNHLPSCSMAK